MVQKWRIFSNLAGFDRPLSQSDGPSHPCTYDGLIWRLVRLLSTRYSCVQQLTVMLEPPASKIQVWNKIIILLMKCKSKGEDAFCRLSSTFHGERVSATSH